MDKQELLAIIDSKLISQALVDTEKLIRHTALRDNQFKPIVVKQLDRGGKRLRPLIFLTASTLNSRKITTSHIKSAAAVELVHQASLFHDQVIDEIEPEISILLLVGDYLLAESLSIASQVSAVVASILARCIAEMSSGQAMQLNRAYKADTANKVYLKTAELKTGALFAAACEIASIVNESSRAEARALKNFGRAFGVAFQIIDDCIDGEFSNDKLRPAQIAAAGFIKRAKQSLTQLEDHTARNQLSNLADAYLKQAMPKAA